MLKKIKTLIAVLALGFAVALPVAAVGNVNAQSITDNLCAGVGLQGPGVGDCGDADADGSGVVDIVQKVVNWLSWFVGIVSVIMIVVGGFKYITSGGDSNKVTGAKNTIIYAIIGLVIVALAQFIVKFVVANAKNVST